MPAAVPHVARPLYEYELREIIYATELLEQIFADHTVMLCPNDETQDPFCLKEWIDRVRPTVLKSDVPAYQPANARRRNTRHQVITATGEPQAGDSLMVMAAKVLRAQGPSTAAVISHRVKAATGTQRQLHGLATAIMVAMQRYPELFERVDNTPTWRLREQGIPESP